MISFTFILILPVCIGGECILLVNRISGEDGLDACRRVLGEDNLELGGSLFDIRVALEENKAAGLGEVWGVLLHMLLEQQWSLWSW